MSKGHFPVCTDCQAWAGAECDRRRIGRANCLFGLPDDGMAIPILMNGNGEFIPNIENMEYLYDRVKRCVCPTENPDTQRIVAKFSSLQLKIKSAQAKVARLLSDDGLWFEPKRITEAHLQNALKEIQKVYGVETEVAETLRHEYDSTRGLWCIDKDPNDVDIEWIRENAFQLTNKRR